MKYNICIPIPVKSANISEIKPILDKIIKKNPNLIELRFDYINDVQNLTYDFIKELMDTISSNIPVIFTFRNFSEGGKIKINQKDRFRILKMFIVAKPDYIDAEMNADKNFLYEFINLASQNGVNIIFSYHNFEKTIKFNETITLLQNFNSKLIQELSLKPEQYQNNVYKVVFTAQTFEDNIIPLRLCKHFSNLPQKLISFCMGPLGIFSRIMCVTVGSFLTYASLEEKTAPGQIHIDEMREIYNLFLKNL
ncbi:MAG: type I 3-dehydroquinate dehydratase [Candidatus Lokiarchaeota archaeon]|nr:type I 3-dehydroquinate dehydratase [Candidatus Lokiarchaeota archaeon]